MSSRSGEARGPAATATYSSMLIWRSGICSWCRGPAPGWGSSARIRPFWRAGWVKTEGRGLLGWSGGSHRRECDGGEQAMAGSRAGSGAAHGCDGRETKGCGRATLSLAAQGRIGSLFRGRVRLFSLEGAACSGWLAASVGLAHAEYVSALWLGNWRWELRRPSSRPRPLLSVGQASYVDTLVHEKLQHPRLLTRIGRLVCINDRPHLFASSSRLPRLREPPTPSSVSRHYEADTPAVASCA